MAIEPDIAVMAIAPRYPEPIDEIGDGLGRDLAQRALPATKLDHAAPLEPVDGGIDAQPEGGVELGRLLFEPMRQPLRQHAHRDRDSLERQRQLLRRFDKAIDRRPKISLEAIALVAPGGAGQYLVADECQKRLARPLRPRLGETLRPAFAGEGARADQHRRQRTLGRVVAGNEIFEAAPQAARAAAPAFL